MIYLSSEFRIHMQKDYLQVSKEIILKDSIKKKKELGQEDPKDEMNENLDDILSCEEKKNLTTHKTQVDVYCPEILIDFNYGSDDSVLFLDNYSETPSSDFLTSNWKFLVFKKWETIKFYYYGLFSRGFN